MKSGSPLRTVLLWMLLMIPAGLLVACEDSVSSGGNEAHGSVRAVNNTGFEARMVLSSHGGSATAESIQPGGAAVYTNVSEGGVTVVAYNSTGAQLGSAGGHVKGGQRLELSVAFGNLRAAP